MDGRLARLDPFGHLSAPYLAQTWLGLLLAFHGLWLLVALVLSRTEDLPYLAALASALALAAACSHPAAKSTLLGAWVLWWAYRLAGSPGLHAGLVVLMAMSIYVTARLVLAWRRQGASAVRVGYGHPLTDDASWPELAGLTKAERKLVVARARAHVGRPKNSLRRLAIGAAIGLAIGLLELAFFPPPDSDGSARTVEPARSMLALVLILPLLAAADPRDTDGLVRRALREHVLPEFERQPWLWAAERRSARTGSAR
jgi:hypothetical protein